MRPLPRPRPAPDRLVAAPSLDDLIADPERARDLPADVARALAFQCVRVLAALHFAAADGDSRPAHPARPVADGERLLTPADVAARIGMSVSWVEKHTRDLPPRVSVAGTPRWRNRDIDRWIKNRPVYGAAVRPG
jgi:predicted DNA-binding transcriptional regulator AlpA